MKNLNKLIALTLTASVFFTNANAQASFTATASATATVVTPLGITNALDMSFGNLSVNAAGGTVVLTPASPSTRTVTGGVTLPGTTGLVQAATFEVTGTGTYTYAITLPSAPVTLTHSNGTATMTATNFTSTPSGTGALTAGAQTIAVGATLNVASSQLAGTYTTLTEFDVTVNYN